MSILAVADCHIGDHPWCRGTVTAGISERAQEGIAALVRAVTLANELEVDRFVVLGDLFDSARPAPVLVAAVQRVLAGAPGPVVLVGNHDQESEAPGHHACAPLAPVAQIVDDITWLKAGGVELVLVAPRSSASPHEGTLERLRHRPWGRKGSAVRVLGLHLGIADKGTPVHLRESNDAILASTASYDLAAAVGAELVIAGNWHWPQAWKFPGDSAEVVQCGTLCPHNFVDAGQEGWAVHVGDDGKVTRHMIPGPRFHKVTALELEQRWPSGLPPHVYASVRHNPEQPAPKGARVRPVATLPESEAEPDTPAVDVHNVEQVIVDHARSLVVPELAAEVERRAREIWQNA